MGKVKNKQAAKKQKTKSKSKAKASHDAPTPPKLIDFMLTGWKAPAKRVVKPIAGHANFADRRDRLGKLFPGEALVIPTGHEVVRANDTNFRFRPGSSFFYLTGNPEADCVLLLMPKKKKGHEHILFVEPNPGRSEPTFFTDRHKGELWVGPRLGVSESETRFGIDRCEPLSSLPEVLKDLKKKKGYRVLRSLSPAIDKALPAIGKNDQELAAALSDMRLIKDKTEIKAIQKACKVTRQAFDDVVVALKTAKSAREVERVFAHRARVSGNDVGYNVIAATGANACILHWNLNNGRIKKNDLLLLDAGIETDDMYTADITRSIPVSGKFTPAQREIYDLVVAAQLAAIDAAKPGNDFLEPHRAAMAVLAQGLGDLGLLPGTVEEALDPENQFYKRYTLHGTSHMLGIDVHDCSDASIERYRQGKLEPGMVLTIEPGLYFQLDDLRVPAKYRGIGIRIEDDVLVTARGNRVLSDFPLEADEVEAWVADLWAKSDAHA